MLRLPRRGRIAAATAVTATVMALTGTYSSSATAADTHRISSVRVWLG